jgi:hypothetical protein
LALNGCGGLDLIDVVAVSEQAVGTLDVGSEHVVNVAGPTASNARCQYEGLRLKCLKALLVAEVMDVSVDGRSTIMEMIYQFASTRNHRLALGPHLIGASDTSMVCADNTSIADSDLYSKR